jgi:hypothetical protein
MVDQSAATAIRMARRYGHIGHRVLRDAVEVLDNSQQIEAASLKKSPKSDDSQSATLQ